MTSLRISPDLELPLSVITQKLAALGISGSGKTYSIGVLVEQMLGAAAQVVIIDTVGNWGQGLRLAANGKDPGFSIPILGGEHGDLPLDANHGDLISSTVVGTASSMVLDVSDFTKGELVRFVTAFATSLLALKKRSKSPLMVVYEECQDIVPQRVPPESARMVGAVEALIKKGRNYGVGSLLISQRAAAVNKDVLNQVETLFAFRQNSKLDRAAVKDWIVTQADGAKGFESELPTLKTGECFCWSPSWLGILQRITFGKKSTFDASKTPDMRDYVVPGKIVPLDMDQLKDKMSTVIQEAKENDPKALKEEVKRLRAQLAADPGAVAFDKTKAETLVRSIGARKKAFEALSNRIMVIESSLRESLDDLHRDMHSMAAEVDADTGGMDVEAFLDGIGVPSQSTEPKPKETLQAKSERIQRVNAERSANKPKDTGGIPIGEFETLKVISSAKDGANLNLIVLVTGYRKGSIKSYTNRLITRGLVRRENGIFFSTNDGLLVAPPAKLPKGDALIDHYRRTLPAGEGQVLGALRRLHPVHMDLVDATTACEGLAMGSVKSYLNRLATRGLVERDKGKSWLSKEFQL